MSIFFNADEVFSMAMMIEENGARFYRKAAETFIEPKINQLLLGLAKDEDKHKSIFSAMLKEYKKSEKSVKYEAEDELLADYLKAFSDRNVFLNDVDPSDILTGYETIEDVLRIAIDNEMKSVMFYLGIKSSIQDQSDKDNIEKIIREEMHHYLSLTMHLSELEGKIN
jgi:rubrerythrin